MRCLSISWDWRAVDDYDTELSAIFTKLLDGSIDKWTDGWMDKY